MKKLSLFSLWFSIFLFVGDIIIGLYSLASFMLLCIALNWFAYRINVKKEEQEEQMREYKKRLEKRDILKNE